MTVYVLKNKWEMIVRMFKRRVEIARKWFNCSTFVKIHATFLIYLMSLTLILLSGNSGEVLLAGTSHQV